MATHRSCDGCGARETADAPLTERGVIKKREYCPACLPMAEGFMKARDVLHDRVADEWQTGYRRLVESTRYDHPDMALPDVE